MGGLPAGDASLFLTDRQVRADTGEASKGAIQMGDYRPSHVGLCVRELERSLRFFCDGLGLREIRRREPCVAIHALERGLGARLVGRQRHGVPGERQPIAPADRSRRLERRDDVVEQRGRGQTSEHFLARFLAGQTLRQRRCAVVRRKGGGQPIAETRHDRRRKQQVAGRDDRACCDHPIHGRGRGRRRQARARRQRGPREALHAALLDHREHRFVVAGVETAEAPRARRRTNRRPRRRGVEHAAAADRDRG